MLPPLFTWIPMPHLPQVPNIFIQQAREAAKDRTIDQNTQILKGIHTTDYLNRQITRNKESVTTRIQQSGAMSPEWEQWCRENIFSDFFETTARISTGASDTHGAHVDKPAKVRLYYLIDQGDSTAETVFYMSPGKSVVHDAESHTGPNPIHELDHDKLIELERVQFPLHQWILFNGYVLHAVEKNSSPRINLTVDINPSTFRFLIHPETT